MNMDQEQDMSFERAVKLMLKAKSSDVYQKLLLKLKTTSYQEIIGASHKELPHSNMLAWIFNRQDLNDAPQSPLHLLIRLIAAKAIEMAKDLKKDLSTYINDRSLTTAVILDQVACVAGRCLREDTNTVNHAKGRSDLLIEGKVVLTSEKTEKDILIIIENKIKSKESPEQCRRYYEAYANRKEYRSYEKIFIYLAPDIPAGYDVANSSNGLSSKHFIILTYQELYDYVLRPLWNFRELFSNETSGVLESYIKTLTSLNDFSNSTVMDKETKDLLSQFFQENKELILAAVQTSQNTELIDDITAAVNNNTTRSKYTVSVSSKVLPGTFSRAGVFEQVVKRLVDLKKTYKEILELFDNAGLGSNNLSETQDKKNYKSPITIEGKKWYLNVNKWTIDAIEKLIKLVSSHSEWDIDISQAQDI